MHKFDGTWILLIGFTAWIIVMIIILLSGVTST